MKKQTILITGGAGFIGSNLADALLAREYKVISIDNFDDFYDSGIKRNNIKKALGNPEYLFIESDLSDTDYLQKKLPGSISVIIHLAAKAGVRSSIINPDGYENKNIQCLKNALKLAVNLDLEQFIFASSSSIYGNSRQIPFNETQIDLNPLNPYAKSKLLAEKIGKDYLEKYNVHFLSLRFFSVYGPRLRPDLVMNKIAHSILFNEPLEIYGNGNASRDFTYIDDIIDGIIRSIDYREKKYDIINLGSGQPYSLLNIIQLFEELTGAKVKMEFANIIKGESDITWADNSKARNMLGFNPATDIKTGIQKYLEWFHNGV